MSATQSLRRDHTLIEKNAQRIKDYFIIVEERETNT